MLCVIPNVFGVSPIVLQVLYQAFVVVPGNNALHRLGLSANTRAHPPMYLAIHALLSVD